MRFLVVGLGSMGKRRIRNLSFLNAGDIVGFDPREDRRLEVTEKFGVETFGSFEEALKTDPTALIISTPPDRHMEYALIAAKNNIHFFTEASVLDDGMQELINLCEGKEIVAAPSCTLRFQPSIRQIKRLVDNKEIGDILTFIYHSGQYLPDWHPWEDYRKFYVAKRATGACREIVAFELVWITWVLGALTEISCFKEKLTKMEIDIDDIYQMLLKTDEGVQGSLTVDVISRVPYRQLKLLSEDGVILWDWMEKTVQVYKADDKTWREIKEKPGHVEKGYIVEEEMYIEEMRHFIEAVEGKHPYTYTFAEDKRILEYLHEAEKSSKEHTNKRFTDAKERT